MFDDSLTESKIGQAINPKHTALFATLFIPGVDKFVHQLYRDNECPDKKKCKANIPSASYLEHILFLQKP